MQTFSKSLLFQVPLYPIYRISFFLSSIMDRMFNWSPNISHEDDQAGQLNPQIYLWPKDSDLHNDPSAPLVDFTKHAFSPVTMSR